MLTCGAYDVSVYGSFDDGGYILLGTINLGGTSNYFPWTFPVTFTENRIIKGRFHLDRYGEWYNFRYKIQHNALNGNDDITVLDRSIITYLGTYMSEEAS